MSTISKDEFLEITTQVAVETWDYEGEVQWYRSVLYASVSDKASPPNYRDVLKKQLARFIKEGHIEKTEHVKELIKRLAK